MSSLEKLVFGTSKFEAPEEEKPAPERKKAAWVDPDDLADSLAPAALPPGTSESDAQNALDRLAKRFDASVENVDTSWAEAKGPKVVDTTDIFEENKSRIPADKFVICRVADMYRPKSKAGVFGIAFSPVADEASVLDEREGVHVVSVNAKRSHALPVIPFEQRKRGFCMCYTADGEYIYVAGQDGTYETIDCRTKSTHFNHILGEKARIVDVKCSPTNKILAMVAGNKVHFVDAFNRQLIRTVATSLELNCGQFTDDGVFYVAAGKEGKGIVIESESMRAVNTFQEPEMQHIHSIAICNGKVAIGTDAGVLHVFDFVSLKSAHPKPLFSKMNLTTKIDTVCFNHTGELLAFGSSGKKDALRVLHVASQGVYSTWPTQNTPISYLRSAAFDRTSQFLAIGNDKGAVTLWELGFYKDKLV